MSTKRANEHIVNIQVVDNVQPGPSYMAPFITSIEIFNNKKLWTLKKKDEGGNFFIVIPNNEQLAEYAAPVSMLKYRGFLGQVKSILEVDYNKYFLDTEL